MVKTIDMQDMRYLNLFEKITRIRTRLCLKYNETIIFCVPQQLITKAVGENGKNVRKISEIIRKKIKIIPDPKGILDSKNFIYDIINPIGFKNLEIRDNEIIINAGNQNKAALIGRNKRRLLELQRIVKDFFEKDLKII
tara:strand:- start:6532 stop:6948 length:417 start_codon:yes stop_codon:yes gene_type:complete